MMSPAEIINRMLRRKLDNREELIRGLRRDNEMQELEIIKLRRELADADARYQSA